MPPTITLKITDNADRRLAVMSVPVGSARKVAHFGSWPSMER